MNSPASDSDQHLPKPESSLGLLRYRHAIAISEDLFVWLDPSDKLVDANPAFCRKWHISPKHRRGCHLSEIIGPVQFEEMRAQLKKCHQGQSVRQVLEMVNTHQERFCLSIQYHPIVDAESNGAEIFALMQDVTHQKYTQKTLQSQESAIQSIFRAAPTGIGVVVNRILTKVNDRLCKMVGYSPNELINESARILYPSDEAHEFVGHEKYRQIQMHGTGTVETRWRRKDGRMIDVLLSSTPIDADDWTKGVTFTALDITARKQSESEREQLQEQYLQAQKMEAIGTLAGGIAHDFNNLLMGILGRTSLIAMDIDNKSPIREHLKSIDACIKSAADLTKQLLGVARGGKYEVVSTKLNRLVGDTLSMFARTKKELLIHTEFAPDAWTVDVDQAQISQVLLNIFVNAWQAMPAGGDLDVTTKNRLLKVRQGRLSQLDPGCYVQISITDTGTGMNKEVQQRIFDPFYTTKETGRGTGLGLASAYGIIENHNGLITVESNEGCGTTFHIYLPASQKHVSEIEECAVQVRHGKESLLLVDDETVVLEVTEKMLKQLGYHVYLAANGHAAIDILRTYTDNIQLVILDMIMPGMGGGDTYNRLKRINPDVKILLSSGYSIDGEATEIIARGCDGFVQKPFSIETISQKIRDVLDG